MLRPESPLLFLAPAFRATRGEREQEATGPRLTKPQSTRLKKRISKSRS
jgi:hypothetical protein